MRISHRFRIAGVSALAAGAVLAALFFGIFRVTDYLMFADEHEELETALNSFTLDPGEAFDAKEFQEAHPTFRSVQFDRKGIAASNPNEFPKVTGFKVAGHWLVFGKPFQDQTIVVGSDLRSGQRTLDLLGLVLAGLWIPLVVLIGATTYLSARSVFRPLQKLTEQASHAAGSNLSQRLETDDQAEFGEFANALNGMLERIETEVARSDRFAADAAHELRTPLAILRTRIDTALLNPRTNEEYVETLTRARAEIVRLTDVAQALLRTARGETEEVPTADLKPLVEERITEWGERFEARRVGLVCIAERAPASVAPEEVRMIVDNLLDNALRFAPAKTDVLVRLTTGETVELTVADHGPGFPAELGDKAFDRLTRGDDSRNRATGGAGIGLSVVRRIAESRGGSAFHTQTTGGGATVTVRLPPAS